MCFIILIYIFKNTSHITCNTIIMQSHINTGVCLFQQCGSRQANEMVSMDNLRQSSNLSVRQAIHRSAVKQSAHVEC